MNYTVKQLRALTSKERGDLGEKEAILVFSRIGWPTQKLSQDEGEDLIAEVNDNFRSSGLKFQFQVKSPEKLDQAKDSSYYYKIDTKHLQRWRNMTPPVFILLWQVGKMQGYWVAVADVLKKIDKENVNWEQQDEVRVFFPASNTTNVTGLKKLRKRAADLVLPYVAQGKQLTCSLDFSFPKTSLGKDQTAEISRFLKTGEEVTVDWKHLTNISFPDWYERLYGPDITQIGLTGQFVVGPRRSKEQIEFQLVAISESGRRVAPQSVLVRAVAIGDEQVRYSNVDEPTPFFFEMVARRNGHYQVTLSLNKSVSNARQMKRVFPLFEALSKGGKLRIQMLEKNEAGNEWRKVEIPLSPQPRMSPSDKYRKLIENLAEIEEATNIPFKLDDSGISQRESILLSELLEIIRTGRRTYNFQKLSYTLGGFIPTSKLDLSDSEKPEFPFEDMETPEEWIKSLLSNSPEEPQPFKITFDAEMEVLGARIPLGRATMTINGSLTPNCVASLEKGLQEGSNFDPTTIELKDGHATEEFGDWMAGEV